MLKMQKIVFKSIRSEVLLSVVSWLFVVIQLIFLTKKFSAAIYYGNHVVWSNRSTHNLQVN
jgi:hypothetical protein